MVSVEEEILAKTGPELFKELLRIYPVAEVDDYFKAGQWKNDQMKCDLQLIHVHRREAGAPDPIPLEDVKMPEMPQATAIAGGIQMPGAGVRPLGAPVTTIRPAVPKVGAAVTVPAPAAPGAAAAGAVTELRLIALFVAKWKLDPTRTKMILAKLLPARRRYVIQHFKCANPGPEATTALEQFILKCEQTNAWAGAVAVAAPGGMAPRAVGPATMAGVKRPLAPTLSTDPSKRPKMMGAIAPTALRPAAGLRPAGPAVVRPPGIRPAGGAGYINPKAKAGQPGSLIKGLLQRV